MLKVYTFRIPKPASASGHEEVPDMGPLQEVLWEKKFLLYFCAIRQGVRYPIAIGFRVAPRDKDEKPGDVIEVLEFEEHERYNVNHFLRSLVKTEHDASFYQGE